MQPLTILLSILAFAQPIQMDLSNEDLTTKPPPRYTVTDTRIMVDLFSHAKLLSKDGSLIRDIDLELIFGDIATRPRVADVLATSGGNFLVVVTGDSKNGSNPYFFRTLVLDENGVERGILYDRNREDAKSVYFRNVFDLGDGKYACNYWHSKTTTGQQAIELRLFRLSPATPAMFPDLSDEWEPGFVVEYSGEPFARRSFESISQMSDNKSVYLSSSSNSLTVMYPIEPRAYFFEKSTVGKRLKIEEQGYWRFPLEGFAPGKARDEHVVTRQITWYNRQGKDHLVAVGDTLYRFDQNRELLGTAKGIEASNLFFSKGELQHFTVDENEMTIETVRFEAPTR